MAYNLISVILLCLSGFPQFFLALIVGFTLALFFLYCGYFVQISKKVCKLGVVFVALRKYIIRKKETVSMPEFPSHCLSRGCNKLVLTKMKFDIEALKKR